PRTFQLIARIVGLRGSITLDPWAGAGRGGGEEGRDCELSTESDMASSGAELTEGGGGARRGAAAAAFLVGEAKRSRDGGGRDTGRGEVIREPVMETTPSLRRLTARYVALDLGLGFSAAVVVVGWVVG